MRAQQGTTNASLLIKGNIKINFLFKKTKKFHGFETPTPIGALSAHYYFSNTVKSTEEEKTAKLQNYSDTPTRMRSLSGK